MSNNAVPGIPYYRGMGMAWTHISAKGWQSDDAYTLLLLIFKIVINERDG